MRELLALAILTALGASAGAEVLRCADAAGNVSYTNSTCPAGAKPERRVSVREPVAVVSAPGTVDTPRASPPQREPAQAAATPTQAQAQAPAGPAIIAPRGRAGEAGGRAESSRWSDRGDDPAVAEYGYPSGGGYTQPNRPRDMRPRIRNCDGAGCEDRQGNHYNRSGQLDRYQGIDGKTCRPVGTTTICR